MDLLTFTELKKKPDFQDKKNLEKYSSAFTLSDMEIFIFPELFYPLVLANIMSPALWEWRDNPWFADIQKKGFTYKANRIKQFIIQNYVFNLDLSTWGLTTKGKEIDRFRDFFDMDMLRQSNALFGYEGDKYYFDIDIRKHFGLDKFNTDVIPYWKTETVEAMNAFRYKEGFSGGAGECVSLSALYAAAMFIVGRIPLEKIFLIATPLHSQNFIIEKEGLITNNRRIVTKNMWFNGTPLSEKARRALENEKVTIVSHISGYIHTIYEEATIDKDAYENFSDHLGKFLVSDINNLVFINFLRFKSKYKQLFQFECNCSGRNRYITLEKVFEYEHNSKFHLSDETREQLICEIEGEEFHLSPIPGLMMLNVAEEYIERTGGRDFTAFRDYLIRSTDQVSAEMITEMITDLEEFLTTVPRIPVYEKRHVATQVPDISPDHSREQIVSAINSLADRSEVARLSLYVYRDMDQIDWLPFLKAALERNPVSFIDLANKTNEEVYKIIHSLPNESIYNGNRLAQPDEVWNFKRGDGVEKALLMADFILNRDEATEVEIRVDHHNVFVICNSSEYRFTSEKKFKKIMRLARNNYSVN